MASDFRQNLRDELDYQNMTVKELSERSRVAKGALDCYLGKQASMPPADTAVRIAEALGVTVEYLVIGQTPEEAAEATGNRRKRALLRLFTGLNEDEQELLLGIARLMTQPAKNAGAAESDSL